MKLAKGPIFMSPIILIPAYQPGYHLIELVKQLTDVNQYQKIIIVDDGSTKPESQSVFDTFLNNANVDLLVHDKNKGKGEALKTGFNYYLKHYADDSVGVVTADADGQHLSTDIYRIAEQLLNDPETLWIGARQFSKKIPLRSQFGNVLTKGIFNLFFKKKLHDTQTGLRGIPNILMKHMVHEPYSGFDFELDMLAYSSRAGIKIKEIPIETVYIENNVSSHFNPFLDSVKIYFVFIRFSAVAIISAIMDYGLFSLFYFMSHGLFWSIVSARILSAIFNFTSGKLVTFRSKNNIYSELKRYVILASCLVLLSYCLVYILSTQFHFSVYVAKIISETILFATSFVVQRALIF
jgi:glycosyltransferase involved in cell wall biosynthesis